MKQVYNFLVCVAVLSSCDAVTYSTFEISNQTDLNIKVISYTSDTIDSYIVKSQETHILANDIKDRGSNSPAQIFFEGVDSICMVLPQKQVIRFYPDSTSLSSGKNIYNINKYWQESNKKNDYVFTFVVAEEDIIDVQD